MKKEMTIFYEVHDNIYVNLTNKCPCACTFCLRQTRDHMENSHVLWLEHAPSFEEVQEAMKAVFQNIKKWYSADSANRPRHSMC